jgi:hypothetical protein
MMGVNACLFTMNTADDLLTSILSSNIYKHFLNSVDMFKATGLNLALMHYTEELVSPNVFVH